MLKRETLVYVIITKPTRAISKAKDTQKKPNVKCKNPKTWVSVIHNLALAGYQMVLILLKLREKKLIFG